MSEQSSELNYQFIRNIYPVRKWAFIASLVFIMLSCFVAVESALLLTSNDATNTPGLVMLSYFVAWLLILIGLIGLKYSCMSTASISQQTITIGHPGHAPIWISTDVPQIGGTDLLPGTVVNGVDFIHAPPPPRYSSLSCAITNNHRRTSINLTATTGEPSEARPKPRSNSLDVPPPAY